MATLFAPEWYLNELLLLQSTGGIKIDSSEGGAAPDRFVYKFLRNAANSDSPEMKVNASAGSPAHFDYVVPPGEIFKAARLNFSLVDGSLRYGQFGGLGAALTNGLRVVILDVDGATEIKDFTDGLNIKANEQFANLAGVDGIVVAAAGDDFLPVRFTIAKAGDKMRLATGMTVRVTVQDNLSGLTFFRCQLQGVLY